MQTANRRRNLFKKLERKRYIPPWNVDKHHPIRLRQINKSSLVLDSDYHLGKTTAQHCAVLHRALGQRHHALHLHDSFSGPDLIIPL